MKSNLPETKDITFNVKENPTLDLTYFAEGKIPLPEEFSAYNIACHGDSGAGQFVKKGPRHVLVAICSGLANTLTFESNGKEHEYPCGTFTWRDGKYRKLYNYSESTTWKENSEWIKKKLKLCQTSPCTIL